MTSTRRTLTTTLSFVFLFFINASAQNWRDVLKSRLPEFGHRNWIIIADAAYPKQSAPGIETIYTNEDQLDVLQEVLHEIEKSQHIKPIVMFDKELEFVKETSAPGVQCYRDKLKSLLNKNESTVMMHEDIIKKLDESSKMFNILLLKTKMTIPYTTVFIELDCGYWNTQKEDDLRKMMNSK